MHTTWAEGEYDKNSVLDLSTHFSFFNIFRRNHFFSFVRFHFSLFGILCPLFHSRSNSCTRCFLYAFFSFLFFRISLFTATFTCVVNNLGGYRVSADTAPARVCIFYLS